MDPQVGSDPSLGFAARCAHALAASDDLDDNLEGLLHAVIDRVDAAAGAVFVLDEDHAELTLTVAVGLSPDPASDASRFSVALGSGDLLAQAVERQDSVWVERTSGEASRLLELTGLGAALVVPLAVVREGIDRALGVMGLCWPERVEVDSTLLAARTAADLAAVAIDRSRATSATAERADWQERLAHTDPLTGLANRRTFDRMLELELARAARQGGEVTVAVFDVDEFSETNRLGGRAAGDAVLRAVASVLAESVRLVDTVGRYGADDFVVVAPGSAGTVVADRIVYAVGSLGEVAGRPVSVSAGVATFPGDGATADELLTAATAALQSARSTGRSTGRAGTTAG